MVFYLAFSRTDGVANLIAWQTDAAIDDPLVFLLNFGTLGAVFFLMLISKLHTHGEVARLELEVARLVEDGKAKDRAMEALVGLMTSRTLPAIANLGQVMAEPQPADRLEAAVARIEQVARAKGVLGDEGST